jgi:hypothetical protein
MHNYTLSIGKVCSMAKRKQDKIKKYRGPKQLREDEVADYLAGELKPKAVSKKSSSKMSQVQDEQSSDDEEDDDDKGGEGYTMRGNDSAEEADEEEEPADYAANGHESESDGDDDIEGTRLEDDGTQVITPPSKRQKRAPDHGNNAPTTIEHYKAMLRTAQARLKAAEQQIRAISKSSLVDKFMAGQVKQYVKQSLWKRCKFITCRETMEECMEQVARHFQITGEKREHWKSTYEHAVRDALNNRRNNTAQCLKKELTGRYLWSFLPLG